MPIGCIKTYNNQETPSDACVGCNRHHLYVKKTEQGGVVATRSSPRQLTAERLFMVRRSFSKLPKTASIPVYCALVRPHLVYAMKANDPTLRADILDQLDRVQRLATRLVRGLHHVPYEERLCQLNLFSLERRDLRANLILAFTIFKGEVNLYPSDFLLHPPRAGLRGHTY